MRRDLPARRRAPASRARRSSSTDSRADRWRMCSGRALVGGEREVTRDHRRLGDGRVPADTELGRDRSLVHVRAARQGRILLVERDHAARGRVVLERASHDAGRHDRLAVVREADGAALGELDHLRELSPLLALRDRGQEADRDPCLLERQLDQRAEHGRRVDDRIGVRHREDGAVPAGCGGFGSRRRSSSSSRPGVRRWTCGSTNAGATSSPSRPGVPGSSRLMTPSSTVTVRQESTPSTGSTTRAPSIVSESFSTFAQKSLSRSAMTLMPPPPSRRP